MSDLRNLYAVVREAERLGHEQRKAYVAMFTTPGIGYPGAEVPEVLNAFDFWTTSQLNLLCDLSRPESRDAIKRLTLRKHNLNTENARLLRAGRPGEECWIMYSGTPGHMRCLIVLPDEVSMNRHPKSRYETKLLVPGTDIDDPIKVLELIAIATLKDAHD